MYKIAGVVVLYNPEMNVIDNLNSYVNQVDKLFVVDNSDYDNSQLVKKIICADKTEYIWNKSNLGIAAALNIGAKKAVEEKFNYLLTMDQDSEASPSLIANLLECFSVDPRIALVSPLLQHRTGRKIEYETAESCRQILSAWTSGNLIDLNIFQLTGGYNEDFFIDYVDHEFCLRLNKMGFKVYLCSKAILKHDLGKIQEVNLLFRKVYPTNHSALRLYYRTRNRFYLKKIYKNVLPNFFKEDDIHFWKAFLKAILFEKNKLKKFKYFMLGYFDYRKKKLGKFERS